MRFGQITSLLLFSIPVVLATYDASPAEVHQRTNGLDSRQTCRTAGWILCPGGISCHPPNTICCNNLYYAPLGATCCAGGDTYVIPPDRCPSGTQPPLTDGTSITSAPVPTSTVIRYTWYTIYYTYYYWYYYYTYRFVEATTVLTSSRLSITSTFSVTATNSAEASSYFRAFTATYTFPTPTQTATVLIGTTPSASSTTSTPAITSSTSSTSSSSRTSTSSVPTTIVAAGAARVGTLSFQPDLLLGVMTALVLLPALLMVAL